LKNQWEEITGTSHEEIQTQKWLSPEFGKEGQVIRERKLSAIKDPVEAIDGILADLDIDSVELQHKARQLWASKITKDLTA
jgi:hypothetical protein